MSGALDRKVALVTGARTGIGAATVRALATQGASVIACGRRPGDCTALVEEITAVGGSVRDHALDVADLAAIATQIAAAVALFGRIDVIVNNAATIEPMAPIETLDPLAFDLAMRTNVSGVAAIVTAAWPHLRGGGRVINLLSGAATRPLHGWAAYCSTKAALLMLTRAIDLEGTPNAIRCFGVAPGLVDTAMQASIRQANINAVSAIAQSDLSPANQPAALIAWIATGAADDLAGTMIDMRDPTLAGRFNP